jgi:copper chaperone
METHSPVSPHRREITMPTPLQLSIEGMSCHHCVNAVRGALGQLPGVTVEQVEIGSARVAYDPDRTTTQAILDAVQDEGYSARVA